MENLNQTDNVLPVPQLEEGEFLMGKILEREGKLSPEEVELICRYQQEHGLRFGEAAIRLGLVSHEDVRHALSRQFRYPQLPVEMRSYPRELIVATDSTSAEAEALRAIRAQLSLRWFKGTQKRLTIAGINKGDGASMLTANLAISFAQLGKRTLIVDANLRRASQDRIFNLRSILGLSDILMGRAGIETVAKVEPFEELAVLPAGTLVSNPTELLSSSAFQQLLDTLDTRFDIILCDAPAFMSAADAVSVSYATGGVMFVAHRNKTSLKDARGANQLLIGTDIQVVGSILLDF